MTPDITVRIRATEILHNERRETLEDLINLFREDGLDGEIAYRPPTGRGVTLLEVTMIYLGGKLLDAATGQIAKNTIDTLVKHVKRWIKGRLERGELNRGQLISLYGPDGKVIKEIRIDKAGVEQKEPE